MAQTGARVLVAASDWALGELLHLLLEDMGYDVHVAEDGLSALEALEEAGAPLIVVLDGQLTGMCGFDVLRAALRDPRLCVRHACILVIGPQQVVPSDIWPLVEALAIPVLPKPLDLDLLFETVAVLALSLHDRQADVNPLGGNRP